MDEGYGLIIEGGLSGQVGVGAEAGAQLDMGADEKFGGGLRVKGTLIFGIKGYLYLGTDWSSKKKD